MIEYVDEHAFIGALGDALLAVSLASVLVSALAYLLAHRYAQPLYTKVGRSAFRVHSAALIGAVVVLFVMLFNKYFEYDYVWKHANLSMPTRYIFSAFWEGQEGSFLLWGFWYAVLGNILVFTARKWENLTMFVVAIAQALIGTMVIGIYVFDYKIGNSPFTLIRELPDNIGLPWTTMPDYLSMEGFQDGRGLNPLLQNYWMTIHPPTLFLGYASTLIPFAFAVAGLWTGQLRAWIKPALPWAFFSIAALGLGILMGGAWAYEALSFGGFWAWDPVENASLIPWLLMVGAAHLMLINRFKNRSLYTTLVLTLLSYIFVLYSSFLVHSGVLGDTSVHSFTGNGMMGQHLGILLVTVAASAALLMFRPRMRVWYTMGVLVLFLVGIVFNAPAAAIVAFLVLSVVMAAVSYNKFFNKPKEEHLWSREFWVFIGSLVLLLSSAQITLETSKPVLNLLAEPFAGPIMDLYSITGIDGFKALADGKLAMNSDRIAHFNKWQIPFAFIITFLIGFGQFLRYGKNDFMTFLKKISLALFFSLALAVLAGIRLDYTGEDFPLLILMFTTLFAVFANLDYFIRILKGRWDNAGGTVAHVGFGLLLLGALISTSRSEKISENGSRFNIERLSEDFKNNEDILLFKQDTTYMKPYFVSYETRFRGEGRDSVNVYYNVDYFESVPTHYREGDLVMARGAVFEALVDHVPGPDFVMDQANWRMIEDPRSLDLDKIKRWTPYEPGEKLFTLYPRIQLNPEFGNVAEPSTKHYWNRDIYTHIRWAELEVDTDDTGFRTAIEVKMAVGDTTVVGNSTLRLNGLSVVQEDEKDRYALAPNDLAVRASIAIRDQYGEVSMIEPLYILRDSTLQIPDHAVSDDAGLKVKFEKIDPREGQHTFLIAEHYSNRREFIVMQAIQFPMINILWIGIIVMILGTVMAIRQRVRTASKSKKS